MAADRICPLCGLTIPPDALEGLCPRCVGCAMFDDSPGHEGDVNLRSAEAPDADGARLAPEKAGDRIGNYRLLQQIGEGGFGVVWMADQERPIRRRVALKIIKMGMDTREVIARFEQERQALALMDHPNIAKVFDAGATQWGRPFFVMELVRGIKITEYCDEANLPTVDRLQLFIAVCHAVQHAHQKGIIHRDLKPSNILVTLHDGVAVPKIIDFGVAKATQSIRLTDLTLFTQFEQMIGTPLYMSPEQAELSGLDVDTRSDIYSLGVLLYELLTGRTPFDPEKLMRQGVDEIRRAIREQEPQKPSTFVGTMAIELRTNVAQRRQLDAARLSLLLRGDLDWIVLKALEKDRSRRYETANGLARDIERHLADEPIHARPASQLYRVRKFARRKPAVAALVGVSGLAILALIGASIAQVAFHAEQTHRKNIEAALSDAERAREGEKAQRLEKEAALVETERARHAEAVARGEEAKQRGIADAAMLNAERLQYFRQIDWARREWEANNATFAEEILDECPSELRQWEWNYLKGLCHTELLAVKEFTKDGLRSLAVTVGSNRIAALSADGLFKMWDAATGAEDTASSEPFRGIGSMAFNRSGTRLATGSANGRVEMWEMPGARKLWSAELEKRDIRFLVCSADASRLAAASTAGAIALVNGETGDLLHPDLQQGEEINSLAMSADGTLIASGSGRKGGGSKESPYKDQPGTIKVWEASTGHLKHALKNEVGIVYSVAFSPDGKRFASGHSDGTVRLWMSNSGRLKSILRGHSADVTAVAFSPDGQQLISGSADHTVKVWTLDKPGDEQGAAVTYRGHPDEVRGVAFSHDGGLAVSASLHGAIKVWDVTRSQEVLTFSGGAVPLVFSPSGKLLAAGSDQEARVDAWKAAGSNFEYLGSLADGKGEFWSRHSGPNVRFAFSRDEKLLAWTGLQSYGPVGAGGRPPPSGRGLSVVNLETHQTVASVKDIGGYAVAFHHDGKMIAGCVATGNSQGTVKMWDSSTGLEIYSFRATTRGVWDLAFSPDGALLALAAGDYYTLANAPEYPSSDGGKPGEVIILDWQARRVVKTLPARRFCVWGLAFSRDGQRLASAGGLSGPYRREESIPRPSRLGEVQVWDVATGAEVFDLGGVDANVFSVAFSPNGKRLVAAAGSTSDWEPAEVKVWDMDTGLLAFTLRGFDQPVYGVAFSPDGKQIATVGLGGVKIFNSNMNEKVLPSLAEMQRDDVPALRGRANRRARLGQWRETVTDLTRILELDPSNHYDWYLLAPLLVQVGDLDTYYKHRREMLGKFSSTTDVPTMGRLANASLLLPAEGADMEAAGKLADAAVALGGKQPHQAYFQFCQGLAQYRRGEFRAAIAIQQEVIATSVGPIRAVQAYAVLAMANLRLGESSEARAALVNADEHAVNFPSDSKWQDVLSAKLLLEEAKALVAVPPVK